MTWASQNNQAQSQGSVFVYFVYFVVNKGLCSFLTRNRVNSCDSWSYRVIYEV
jgi:hypothetical protein